MEKTTYIMNVLGINGYKHGKVDQKMLRYTKTINVLVKGLKVVAKRYLS